jgi:hypothetical protein
VLVDVYNPSYLEDIARRITIQGQPQAKREKHYLKNNESNRCWGCVVAYLASAMP